MTEISDTYSTGRFKKATANQPYDDLNKSTNDHKEEAMKDKKSGNENEERDKNFNDENFNSALVHVEKKFKELFVNLLIWLDENEVYKKLDWGVANHSYSGAGPSTIVFGKAQKQESKTGKRPIGNAVLRLVAKPASKYGHTSLIDGERFVIDADGERPPILVIRASLLNYLRNTGLLNEKTLPNGFNWVFRINGTATDDEYALVALINTKDALENVQTFLNKISELILKEVA